MAHFSLLSIDFKVCRLITETVSDYIRKTVISSIFSSPFSEARTRSVTIADTSSTFSYTSLQPYGSAHGIAVDILKWKDRFNSP